MHGKPTVGSGVFDNTALATYFDLVITSGKLVMQTKAAIKDMLDIARLGATEFSPTFKITCDGVDAPAVLDNSLTIQIHDQNTQAPKFNNVSSKVIDVDIEDWVAATAINENMPIKVVDLDYSEINANPTVTSNNTLVVKHTNTTIAKEDGKWTTSVKLYLNETVAYGTHYVTLTAKDAAHPVDELTLTIRVSGASQIGGLLMVIVASVIGTWVML